VQFNRSFVSDFPDYLRKSMALMESISGVRGIVGESLTPDVVVRYAQAFADFCGHRPIVVGRDGRITGRTLTNILVSTLLLKGSDVRAIGICPTPTVALETEHSDAAGGVIVTASHNPIQWNGLKFLASDGLFLDAHQNAQLRKFLTIPSTYRGWNEIGSHIVAAEAIEKHIDAALGLPGIDRELIGGKKFRVALDCVNAAGGAIVPELLRRLGCDVIELNCDISGVFAHTPEPLPENLTELAAAVRTENADIGIAVDPDVDRLVLIDESGKPIGEEYTIATIVQFVLSHTRKEDLERPVVINLSTTRAVEDIAASFGTPVLRTPVGEINVAKKMREVKALVGGEGSGGIIHPALHYGRDAIGGIVMILQYLAESGAPLSRIRSSLPHYEIVKDKIILKDGDPDAILLSLTETIGQDAQVNTDDGVRIDYPDGWVHFRKSNTEPIIRVIAESTSLEAATEMVNRYREKILFLM
jgi:phosphomannomutase